MEAVNRKLIIWYALAHATVLESIRRKDIYVAAILCGLLFITATTIGSFGVKGLEIFYKDVALTVIGLLSTVLAVLLSARQVAEEVSRRTVYPLLARPISRFDLLFGKFLGAYALSVFTLLLLAGVCALCLSLYNIPLGSVFLQYLLLRAFALAVLCAMTLMLSLFLTPEATVTLSLLLAVGSATFAGAVKLMYPASVGAQQKLLAATYFVIPQLNLFDLGKKVSYGWSPVPVWVIGSLLTYAAIYSALFLFIGTLRFKRQAL